MSSKAEISDVTSTIPKLTAESLLKSHKTVFYDYNNKPGQEGTMGFVATDYEERYAWTHDLDLIMNRSELSRTVKLHLWEQSALTDAKSRPQQWLKSLKLGRWSDKSTKESEEQHRERHIRLGIQDYLTSLGEAGANITIQRAEIPVELSQ